jgi:hypothetical protein
MRGRCGVGGRVLDGRVRIRLKLELDCAPDGAWDLVRSPAAFRAVSAPLMVIRSREPGGFPERWSTGEHRVSLALLGLIPLGEQVIRPSFRTSRGARIMTDDGEATAGAITAIRGWRHQMAVSPGRRGGALYRDQLEFEAGPAGIAMWPLLWLFWQWRAAGLRRLAKHAEAL